MAIADIDRAAADSAVADLTSEGAQAIAVMSWVSSIALWLDEHRERFADLPHALVDDIVRERQLVHRLGTIGDVVSAMLYLCSDESSFITWETLKVSSG